MAKKHDDDKGYDDRRPGASHCRVEWTQSFSISSHAREWRNFAACESAALEFASFNSFLFFALLNKACSVFRHVID